MTGSIRNFEKSNFTSKLSALVFLKVKLPNMTDWHISLRLVLRKLFQKSDEEPAKQIEERLQKYAAKTAIQLRQSNFFLLLCSVCHLSKQMNKFFKLIEV